MVHARWTKLAQSDFLQRSSHNVSIINGKVLVFGGELRPREPRDNKIFTLGTVLDSTSPGVAPIKELPSSTSSPSPRVGAASATLGDRMYVFSGRGGKAMKPMEEEGALWMFNPDSSQWSMITPQDVSAPFPPARSYHCMTSDGSSKLYLHAGCPESGRLSDLWSFDLPTRTWQQLADAEGPPRGGPSIAHVDGHLYRMNGFDGNTEQGGQVDCYNIATNSWSARKFNPDGVNNPGPRSVSSLLPVNFHGRPMLVTLFGECDPSSQGHAGAGKMLQDIWVYDIGQNIWQKVETGDTDLPKARGWFDADIVDETRVVVVGGLNENNERLGDAWILAF